VARIADRVAVIDACAGFGRMACPLDGRAAAAWASAERLAVHFPAHCRGNLALCWWPGASTSGRIPAI